ncbi:leucine zipper domain-containing protein [Streptomyces sp. NPDC005892]|uniref:leucine zipper domain-containing protein n=1 Tax=Streptomyces sp. NPDC005892 TaxID=3155593 RepID=UPI0033FCFCD5
MRTPLERRRKPKARGTLPQPSIAQMAAGAGVSRACLSTRKSRYDTYGEAGLQDHSSVPRFSPSQAPTESVEKRSPNRVAGLPLELSRALLSAYR